MIYYDYIVHAIIRGGSKGLRLLRNDRGVRSANRAASNGVISALGFRLVLPQ
jgi:pyruvate carboxylase